MIILICIAAPSCADRPVPRPANASSQAAPATQPTTTDRTKHWNIILGEITSWVRNDDVPHGIFVVTIEIRTISDKQGKIEPGTLVRVQAEYSLGPVFTNSGHDLPAKEPNGSIIAWLVAETETKNRYEFLTAELHWGLIENDAIPPVKLADARAAFAESTMTDALGEPKESEHRRAYELINGNNDYLWSLGVWRLSRKATRSDYGILKKLYVEQDLTIKQAYWLDSCIGSMASADHEYPDDHVCHGLLFEYLRKHQHKLAATHPAKQQNSPATQAAPATAPAQENIVLGEVISWKEEAADQNGVTVETVQLKVAADKQSNIKPGAVVKVIKFHEMTAIREFGPQLPKKVPDGSIVAWRIKATGSGQYAFQTSDLPFGLRDDDTIPPEKLADAQAALVEFSWADVQWSVRPSRANAYELIAGHNYYLWALGVWRITQNATMPDIERLERPLHKDLTMDQVVWLDLALRNLNPADNEPPTLAPNFRELHQFLRSWMWRQVYEQPPTIQPIMK